FQEANRATAHRLVMQRELLLKTALAEGFTSNSLVMTEGILQTWHAALATRTVFWPSNENSRWILGKFMAHSDGGFLVLGLIYPGGNTTAERSSRISALSAQFSEGGIWISGWELLGSAIFEQVAGDFWR